MIDHRGDVVTDIRDRGDPPTGRELAQTQERRCRDRYRSSTNGLETRTQHVLIPNAHPFNRKEKLARSNDHTINDQQIRSASGPYHQGG
jgi:hypothetical protein